MRARRLPLSRFIPRLVLMAFYGSLITASPAQVPGILNYQGRVTANGTNFDGVGQFKFALVDGAGTTNYWSHDGTSAGEPASAAGITVSKGLYSVQLGQPPMPAVTPPAFSGTDVWLRVWFDGGSGMQQLAPDQRLAAVGYSMVAATVPGSGISGAIPDARLSGNVGIGTNSPAERLEVAGRIVVADSTNAASKAGTIRWTGRDFEGYDGLSWVSLSPVYLPEDMVYVPGGTFTMGWTGLATPTHEVTLSSYYLGKREVTYGLWYTVCQWAITNGYAFQNPGREGDDGTNGVPPTADSTEPVTQISWRDAIVWCNAYSERLLIDPVYTYSNAVIRDSRDSNALACDAAECNRVRSGHRLPTEAEWEYAARYGKGSGWTPGNWASGASADYSDATACDAVAWYSVNSTSRTHAVEGRLRNQLGVYDMSGNVWELCWDWKSTAYDSAPATDPLGPSSGSDRCLRGGAWNRSALYLRASFRSSLIPSGKASDTGLRLVRTAK